MICFNQKSVMTTLVILFSTTAVMLAQEINVEHNSTTASPHLRLIETQTDFSRIKMQNNPNPGKYWDIAGRPASTDPISLLNFYYFNGQFGRDHMTITGEGKVGIGDTTPSATLDVNGYTRLGTESDSPQIKTKLIDAVSPSTGTINRLPHGLGDYDRILAVHVMVLDNLDGVFFYTHRDIVYHDNTEVGLTANIGNNRTYRMYIIYQD